MLDDPVSFVREIVVYGVILGAFLRLTLGRR
jgi:hypothetical protein